MEELTYEEQVKQYRQWADDYFAKCGICPCPEEIVEYVAEKVEDESGCGLDDVEFKKIAKILGITLD